MPCESNSSFNQIEIQCRNCENHNDDNMNTKIMFRNRSGQFKNTEENTNVHEISIDNNIINIMNIINKLDFSSTYCDIIS